MTLSSVTQGEVFTVRTYKTFTGFAWANTYEVQATTDIPNPDTAFAAMVDRIVALERALHLDGIVIDRVVVSSYVPDGTPYNPETFATFPYSVTATRPAVPDLLPLELCLFVRRDVALGRDGRLLYRGVLMEQDMTANSLRPLLTSAARNNIQGIINTWFGTGGLPQGWQFVMASGRPNVTNVRQVQGLTVSEKIVVKKLNNRYYDRTRTQA